MNFVHDTNLDIGIGKSEKNETGNEKEQTSGGKSTKVYVAGQNKRPGRACTTRFQLYRTQQEQGTCTVCKVYSMYSTYSVQYM